MHLPHKKILFPIFFYIVIFILIRSWNYSQLLTCSTDQGMHLLSTWNMWETKQPVLIGPSSSWAVDGRNFFFGPAPYYLALPALVLFGWEQLSVSIVLTSFQLIAGLFVFWVLVRKKQPWLAWLFLIMYGFSAWGIHTSRYFWNPNFTYPIGGFSLGLTLLINSKTKLKKLLLVLLGTTLGIGIQSHYAFLLVLIITVGYLIYYRSLKIKDSLFLIFGLGLGLSPLILFELRNDFYNLRTMAMVMNHKIVNPESSFKISWFYLLGVFPWFAFFLSTILRKLPKTYAILFPISVLSLWFYQSLPPQQTGKDMRQNWSCQKYETIATQIRTTGVTNFNIVDQHTGDTQAVYLRWLLTKEGPYPNSPQDYPSSNHMFVYTELSQAEVLNSPLWELSTSVPWRLVSSFDLGNSVLLYHLSR